MSIEEVIRAAVAAEVERLHAGLARVEEKLATIAQAQPPLLVDVREAARRLDLSESTIRRRIRDGTLPSQRVGRAVRVDLAAVRPATEEEVARMAREARAGMPRPAPGGE